MRHDFIVISDKLLVYSDSGFCHLHYLQRRWQHEQAKYRKGQKLKLHSWNKICFLTEVAFKAFELVTDTRKQLARHFIEFYGILYIFGLIFYVLRTFSDANRKFHYHFQAAINFRSLCCRKFFSAFVASVLLWNILSF